MRRISIAGTGYVGLGNAILLAQNNPVEAHDIVAERVEWLIVAIVGAPSMKLPLPTMTSLGISNVLLPSGL